MLLKRTFVFLFLFSFLNVLHAQTANDIILRYIEYIGGEKKWYAVKTIVTTGTYDYGGIVFPFTSYSKAPDLYKYIVTSNGKYFAQAFDGNEGWKIDGFKNETQKTMLTGKAATAMMNEADVELESPLIDYKKKGSRITSEGQDTVDAQTCFKLKFIRNNGDTERYFFNTKNFELVKKQMISKNDELDGSMIDIFYSDYREVNGIKIPFKAVTKAGDQTILTITVDKVILNEPVSSDEFKP